MSDYKCDDYARYNKRTLRLVWNGRTVCELSFFPDRKPVVHTFHSLSEIPVSSPESDAMSKDMKERGFKSFGTTICYAHLQASGFINNHLADCFCRKG